MALAIDPMASSQPATGAAGNVLALPAFSMEDYAMMVDGAVPVAPRVIAPKATPKATNKRDGSEAPAGGPFSDLFGQ